MQAWIFLTVIVSMKVVSEFFRNMKQFTLLPIYDARHELSWFYRQEDELRQTCCNFLTHSSYYLASLNKWDYSGATIKKPCSLGHWSRPYLNLCTMRFKENIVTLVKHWKPRQFRPGKSTNSCFYHSRIFTILCTSKIYCLYIWFI